MVSLNHFLALVRILHLLRAETGDYSWIMPPHVGGGFANSLYWPSHGCGSPSTVARVSASLMHPQRETAGIIGRGGDGSAHMRPDPEATAAL